MNTVLIKKEINDFLRSKTTILFTILFSAIISYSFYSAVTLYSKASVVAMGDIFYATGFEPVLGIFVPTFGGFFIIMSLIAPFLFIQPISIEKKYNTLTLLSQFPSSLGKIFITKFFSAVLFLLILLAFSLPTLIIWHFLGGHIPFAEISIMFLGYFLYGVLIIAISFFSASLFNSSAQASITALALIIFSWFLDFGKDMNILSFLTNISHWSLTEQLKYFENGILSFQTIFYFISLISFFCFTAYIFFNFSIRNKLKPLLWVILIFLSLLWIDGKINRNFDFTESRRNSFSKEQTEFLKKIPSIKIDIFLEPTDSRTKDYRGDFLKKLKLVKSSVKVNYIMGKELNQNYGLFRYSVNGKSETTFSNSEEEIFMVLQKISGEKIDKKDDDSNFKGYPLVLKTGWSIYLFALYLIILPVIILIFYFKNQISRRTK